jgi:hypothetical protein
VQLADGLHQLLWGEDIDGAVYGADDRAGLIARTER